MESHSTPGLQHQMEHFIHHQQQVWEGIHALAGASANDFVSSRTVKSVIHSILMLLCRCCIAMGPIAELDANATMMRAFISMLSSITRRLAIFHPAATGTLTGCIQMYDQYKQLRQRHISTPERMAISCTTAFPAGISITDATENVFHEANVCGRLSQMQQAKTNFLRNAAHWIRAAQHALLETSPDSPIGNTAQTSRTMSPMTRQDSQRTCPNTPSCESTSEHGRAHLVGEQPKCSVLFQNRTHRRG